MNPTIVFVMVKNLLLHFELVKIGEDLASGDDF